MPKEREIIVNLNRTEVIIFGRRFLIKGKKKGLCVCVCVCV